MDIISLGKNSQLFWLGRYAERVYQSVELLSAIHDKLLDEDDIDVISYCNKLGINESFDSAEDFCKKFGFDRDFSASALASADAMLGNGMVLRELLGSQTLSYLQMATSALEAAANNVDASYEVQLQWVLDDIMAFRGCCSERIESQAVRNTIKTGASVERVSSMVRFTADDEALHRELSKLTHRLKKTQLEYNKANLEKIQEFILSKEDHPDRSQLLQNVETLFQI